MNISGTGQIQVVSSYSVANLGGGGGFCDQAGRQIARGGKMGDQINNLITESFSVLNKLQITQQIKEESDMMAIISIQSLCYEYIYTSPGARNLTMQMLLNRTFTFALIEGGRFRNKLNNSHPHKNKYSLTSLP